MSSSLQDIVRSKYGDVAKSDLSSDNASVRAVAEAFGYSADELASIPAQANMGLSCGNPIASASLRPGETVVDLGSGGGLDVFLAAQKVGPAGKAIGIDMTPEMLERARKNALQGPGGKPFTNVEFLQGHIDAIPLPDACVDCITSNCVINLASDKQAVFREMFRVLKPGGRVAVSDIALKQPLPAELARDIMAFVGCIAGAISINDYRQGLAAAGFSHVHVQDTGADLNAYAKVDGQGGCCAPPMTKEVPLAVSASSCCAGDSCCTPATPEHNVHSGLSALLQRYNVNDYAASVRVLAVKPK